MSRVATWVRRPEDRSSVLGWIVWGDCQLPEPRRRTLTRLSFAAIAAVTAIGSLFGPTDFILGTVAAWLGLAFYARPGAREHGSLPSMGEGAFPVSIDVRVGPWRTGRENGWIAFVDGWLVYEGLRTSFSVRAADVHLGSLGGQPFLRFPDRQMVWIALLTDRMQTNRPGRWGDRRRLLEAFENWRRRPVPEGEPVLPPRETSLRVEGERVARRVGFVSLFVLVAFGAALGGEVRIAWGVVLVAAVLLMDALRIARKLRERLQRVESGLVPRDGGTSILTGSQ